MVTDPRNFVSFEGIDAEYATFKIDNSTITYDKTMTGGSASIGLAVEMSADNTVALLEDAKAIVGRLEEVFDDNFCRVQINGGMTLKGGTGATLTAGSRVVGALLSSARGYVRAAAATAAEALTAKGQIYDGSDATAVAVML